MRRRTDVAVEGADLFQSANIVLVDLIERDIAMSIVAFICHQPAVDTGCSPVKFFLGWSGGGSGLCHHNSNITAPSALIAGLKTRSAEK